MADEPGSMDGGEATRHGRYVARHRRSHRWSRRGSHPVGAYPRPRRTVARRLLIGVNIVVGVSLVASALGVAYAEVQLHRINRVHVAGIVKPGRSGQSQQPQVTTHASGPPMTVLLVGSDSRAALDQSGDSQFGSSANVGGARSDTIILARIVPATHQIALLSIPRDLLVSIPGRGEQRINTAINTSPDLLIQVIHAQLGIDINHYVDIDFDSFRQIADAVGGVEVYFPTAAKDAFSGLSIPSPGCFNLTGDQALAFVRSREYEYYDNGEYHQEAQSDLARIDRQQIFIRKLIKKAESTGITSPLKLNGIISGLTQNVTVDNTFSVSDMVDLVKDFGSVDAATIPGSTLDTSPTTLSGGSDVLLPEAASDQAQVQQFLALGTTPTPTSTSTATPSTGPAGATTTTTTVPGTTTIDPSTITVEVVNGSGVAGQAGQASSALRAIGFDVTSISSAQSYGSGPTQVFYGAGGEPAAQTVASHIGGRTMLESDSSLSSSTVRVVTAGEFTGITTATSTAQSSTSASTSASTTVPSSTTTTTYALPGTPVGQTPPTCGD